MPKYLSADDRTICIINGYLRNEEKSLKLFHPNNHYYYIPSLVIKQIQNYVNDHFMVHQCVLSHTITDKKHIDDITNANLGQKINLYSYKVANTLEWHWRVYPNGVNSKNLI